MTDLRTVPSSGGLYALPAGPTGWLSDILGTPSATRAELFSALNTKAAEIIMASSPDTSAEAALAAALGMPARNVWHNNAHPLRSPEAARAACAALISSGYNP